MPQNSFWTDISVEPKRAFRWVLYMGGFPQWIIKTVNKPNVTFTESKHQYLNHTFYYPGRAEWNEITVKLVDPIAPDAAKTIENIMRASGYDFPIDQNSTTTISKLKAVSALGLVSIVQIGSEGETIEEWQLTNAWIKSAKFGDLNYESDDMVEIELTLRYDFARLAIPSTDAGVPPASA